MVAAATSASARSADQIERTGGFPVRHELRHLGNQRGVARSLLRVQSMKVGTLYTFGYATVRTGDGLRQLLDDRVDLVVDCASTASQDCSPLASTRRKRLRLPDTSTCG